MKVELTQEEAVAVLKIIARTTFQGGEAESVVQLKQRISGQLQEETKEEKK